MLVEVGPRIVLHLVKEAERCTEREREEREGQRDNREIQSEYVSERTNSYLLLMRLISVFSFFLFFR